MNVNEYMNIFIAALFFTMWVVSHAMNRQVGWRDGKIETIMLLHELGEKGDKKVNIIKLLDQEAPALWECILPWSYKRWRKRMKKMR